MYGPIKRDTGGTCCRRMSTRRSWTRSARSSRMSECACACVYESSALILLGKCAPLLGVGDAPHPRDAAATHGWCRASCRALAQSTWRGCLYANKSSAPGMTGRAPARPQRWLRALLHFFRTPRPNSFTTARRLPRYGGAALSAQPTWQIRSWRAVDHGAH